MIRLKQDCVYLFRYLAGALVGMLLALMFAVPVAHNDLAIANNQRRQLAEKAYFIGCREAGGEIAGCKLAAANFLRSIGLDK